MAEFLFNGLKTAAITLVLAHGAGGPMDSPFMETIAEGVARAGIRVARFEFLLQGSGWRDPRTDQRNVAR
jgi:predicted alpha/beta-hydrolase family hydrolase